ncbi:unnamed protein product [Miscanthus lutarioriparius]|uniref:Uncharacterized protein n=1 Tax=Miscanthus lutarioriparius TaxID=422564 RepID=A0A811R1A8_9POAL|nr:unnamed protein product [Miscanthus lutarioriparius]
MAPPAASISSVCCVPFPASAPRRASPSSVRRLPRFAARSSGGGGGTRPEPKPDDNESKAVLDAFFLGKAFAEALTERVESVVGEVFSVVGQWQAEQQKLVLEFQVLRHTVLAPDEHSQYFVFHVNSPMSSLVIDDISMM